MLPLAVLLAHSLSQRDLVGLQGWFAPNITNDAQPGLGIWSADDIVSN